MLQRLGQPESGELLEYFIDIVTDFFIAGKQSEV